ncbi:MAG: hypothetical protein D6701_08575 [Gemmatimonadetes bacterium]|nr:MAG: hypothetical protein D6701_08575 [Gemmatimonadota bacterium]
MTARRILRRVAHNGRLKAAALGLAVFLWALMRLEVPAQDAVSLPVQVRVTDPGFTAFGEPSPATVDVLVSGPVGELSRLRWGDAAVVVAVEDGSVGDIVVPLRPSHLVLADGGAGGVVVEGFRPPSVRVHLARVATASVPLRLALRGRLPEHLALGRPPSLSPAVVRVTGPAAIVEALDSLDIVAPDLGEVTLEGTLVAAVDTAGLAGVSIEPDSVLVRVPVEEAVERVVSSVPVRTPSGHLAVEPATVDVRVRGARSRVESLDPTRLAALVVLEALTGADGDSPVRVPLIVTGVPPVLSAQPLVDSVLVRRIGPS